MGTRQCCRLVDISCNYNLTPRAQGHLQFTRSVGMLRTPAITWFGRQCFRNKFQTQRTFKRSTETGKFSRKSHKKRQQGKTLSVPNHRRNADQNDKKKSNPIWQKSHPDCLQTVKTEERREMMETHSTLQGNERWQQPLERTATTGQNGKFQES